MDVERLRRLSDRLELQPALSRIDELGRLPGAGAGFDARVLADADRDFISHGVVLRDEVSELALAIQEVRKTLKILVGRVLREEGESRRLLRVVACAHHEISSSAMNCAARGSFFLRSMIRSMRVSQIVT